MFIGQIKSKKESQYKSRENQQIEGKINNLTRMVGQIKKKTMQEQYPGSQVCKDDERTLWLMIPKAGEDPTTKEPETDDLFRQKKVYNWN